MSERLVDRSAVLSDYFSTHGSVLGCCARRDGMGTTTSSSSEPSSSVWSPSRSVVSERGKAEDVVSNCLRNILGAKRRRGAGAAEAAGQAVDVEQQTNEPAVA